jgi:uncharacterized OsmC-like protein
VASNSHGTSLAGNKKRKEPMKLTITHQDELRFNASNGSHNVTIDLPIHSGGTDQGMTPPDLFVSALGSCIGVYVVDYCERVDIPHEGLCINLEWKVAEQPKRIGKLNADIVLPLVAMTPEYEEGLREATERCLLHNTLHQAPKMALNLRGNNNISSYAGTAEGFANTTS